MYLQMCIRDRSTVTMQIQTLERELGVSLFERNGKSAVLSAAGKEFLDYAYNLQRCEAMALEPFAEGADPDVYKRQILM